MLDNHGFMEQSKVISSCLKFIRDSGNALCTEDIHSTNSTYISCINNNSNKEKETKERDCVGKKSNEEN